jgi:hypothetical protein
MTLVVPNQLGEILMLQYIVGLAEAGNPVLHLYGNLNPNPANDPTDSTVVSDLTECTSAGYTPITLVSNQWTVQQTGGVTTAVYSEQTFNFTTAARVYGYFITDTAGHLLWLEKFPTAPYDVPIDGGSISVLPELSLT